MKKGQIILASAGTVIVASGIYFGFIHKFKDGFFGWEKLTGAKMTRVKADKILGVMGIIIPASYGDDYVIAWAQARRGEKPTFTIDNKNYSTKTGKLNG